MGPKRDQLTLWNKAIIRIFTAVLFPTWCQNPNGHNTSADRILKSAIE